MCLYVVRWIREVCGGSGGASLWSQSSKLYNKMLHFPWECFIYTWPWPLRLKISEKEHAYFSLLFYFSICYTLVIGWRRAKNSLTFSALPAIKMALLMLLSEAFFLASSTAPVVTSMPMVPRTCGAMARLTVPAHTQTHTHLFVKLSWVD